MPTEGNISALNIPHSSMVFDHHEVKEIRADLLGERGIAVETIRHADIVSFTCLKAFALEATRSKPLCLGDVLAVLAAAAPGLTVSFNRDMRPLIAEHPVLLRH